MKAMKIDELKTPAFLVDLPKLKINIRAMQGRARKHGVRLRPHVKTHKTAEIARLQIADEASGITVSTLAEAHFFASRYPLWPRPIFFKKPVLTTSPMPSPSRPAN